MLSIKSMKTVSEKSISSIEVMKSRFIGILLPLNNADEFKSILEGIRKEHSKARHVVYAYRNGSKSKSCDDKEPKGTAGRPLLELLYKKDLDNVALIVVRYFGGTKLGAGRLLRTYLQAGINVVESAQIVEL